MSRVKWIQQYLIDVYKPEYQSFLPYYDAPKNDNEKLMNLQKEWYCTGSEDAWKNLWEYSLFVCKKFARDYYRKRKLFHNREDVYDKAMIGTEYVLKRFRLDNFYYCSKNFSSQLFMGVKHAFDYSFQTKTGRLYEEAEKMCVEQNVEFRICLEVVKARMEEEEKQKRSEAKKKPAQDARQLDLFSQEELIECLKTDSS